MQITQLVVGQVTNNRVEVRLPVISGTQEALDDAQAAADRILETAPEDAVGVFIVLRSSGAARPVAFESSAGELVGFFAHMDQAVADLDIEAVASELAESIRT
jgi:hypothetical protein